jgi:DNA-binding NarL/FixJ family response regulator
VPVADVNPREAGQAALARAAWDEARAHFEAAVAAEEDSGAAWEGLGWAGWWLGDGEATISSRERGFRAYRQADDARGAARLAAWLANDAIDFRGEYAVAAGWLERSRSLLAEDRRCLEYGWLLFFDSYHSLKLNGDVEGSIERARRTAALGGEIGVADLEALGLAVEGDALVTAGAIEEGMRCLDAAAGLVTAEEFEDPLITPGFTQCILIAACEKACDFGRVAQWCEAMRVVGEELNCRHVIGVCRSAYGNVLTARGDWPRAEAELTDSLGELEATRPGLAPGGLVRLGELRVRQGRAEEARDLFERAGSNPMALTGLGALALQAGEARDAAEIAERILRRPAGPLDQVPALELLARARARLGEFDAARAALARLEGVLTGRRTPYLTGRSRLIAGELALAEGQAEDARRVLEDAVDLFLESAAPYETALARLDLATALAALGREEATAREANAAREGFAELGASADAERAEQVARGEAAGVAGATAPGALGAEGGGAELGELTPREQEVLRLVAQGLSDAAIAEQLVLSPHTVHRHVANVRTKLRLPSRAAAVAYAAREGLI